MKRTAAIMTTFLLGSFALAHGATDVGVRVGYYFDAEAVSIGTELITPLGSEDVWYFNPNVELAMGDFRDTASFNADFHYDFQSYSELAVWAGAGPALYIIDRGPFRDDDVEPAANVLFGLGGRQGDVRPYAQFKGVFMSDPEAVLEFGLRF